MGVSSCRTGNWRHSFDRAGWSKCPSNTYLQGLYKGGCNWIYCIEYGERACAVCCDNLCTHS